MQFFNFTLRFDQVRWDLKVPLRISEEIPKQKHPKQKHPSAPLTGYAFDLPFSDCWTDLFFSLDAFSH